MKPKIISRGQTKSGVKTAQIVINGDGKSVTKHLRRVGQERGEVYQDVTGKKYEL
jgi:hypothetical protein